MGAGGGGGGCGCGGGTSTVQHTSTVRKFLFDCIFYCRIASVLHTVAPACCMESRGGGGGWLAGWLAVCSRLI